MFLNEIKKQFSNIDDENFTSAYIHKLYYFKCMVEILYNQTFV